MSKKLVVLTGLVALLLGAGAGAAAEKKVKMQDLPLAVQKIVTEQSKGATLKGLSTEVDKGKTIYEAELTVNGHGKDVSIDAQGKIVSVEEEVAIESIPGPAREAIQKSAAKGKILKLESVNEGGKTFYEAQLQKGAKKSEIKVDANGKPVK